MWGSRGTYGILESARRTREEEYEAKFKKLKDRTLEVVLKEGTLNADGRGSYNLDWQRKVSSLLNTVDGLLPNSWLELKSIQTDLNWSKNNFEVAHYGVDSKKFLDADPEKFRNYSGIRKPFIMQAGRIEAGKNQAMLCWAMKNTNIPIVLIGGSKHWPSYKRLCKEINGKNLVIIDHLPQDLLASAYAASRVHCLVSWMDTCGLVSLEAALSNTPLVGSTFGHELEYLQNDAWLADPGDSTSIREAVLEAWETGTNSKKTERLKQRILSDFNWEKTVSKTESIYNRVI